MKYTSLLIDIDDTLLDFSAAEKSAVSGVLKNNDLPFDDDTVTLYSRINLEFWKSFERGDILREEIFEGRFKKLLSIIGKTGDTKKIADEYFFALANEHQLMQGATDILDYLSKKGYKLYAATNGLSKTQFKRIREADIEKYFDDIFVSESVGFQKPQAEYYNYIVENIAEKDKSKILIIGDSQSSDILGGKNAFIDTCFFNLEGKENKYGAKFEIQSLAQLKTIL